MTRDERCRQTRELLPWYTTGVLAAQERENVQQHLADCADCRAQAEFSQQLYRELTADGGFHPPAEELVLYADGDSLLPPRARRIIADHLVVCADCRREVEILRLVTRESAAVPRRKTGQVGHPSRRLGRWWRRLLSPAPAAAYLATAVGLALILLLPGTGREPVVRTGSTGGASAVMILADDSAVLRDADATAAPVPVVSLPDDAPLQLLLELTELAGRPAPGEVFTVSVAGPRGNVLTRRVRAELFRDDNALLLTLPAQVLSAGEYGVSVSGPAGQDVYHARFRCRP